MLPCTNTFMFTAGVMIQITFTFKTCLTFLTLVQLLARPSTNRDIMIDNFISSIQDTSFSKFSITYIFIVLVVMFVSVIITLNKTISCITYSNILRKKSLAAWANLFILLWSTEAFPKYINCRIESNSW